MIEYNHSCSFHSVPFVLLCGHIQMPFFFSFFISSFCLILSLYFVLKDKILQGSSTNETVQVTNDGATILKAIGVDNPAAKVLVGKRIQAD